MHRVPSSRRVPLACAALFVVGLFSSAAGLAQSPAPAPGYDIEMTAAVAEAVGVPVVASGGAGCPDHLYEVLTRGKADAALAASIFHYNEFDIPTTKAYLAQRGVPVRQLPRRPVAAHGEQA